MTECVILIKLPFVDTRAASVRNQQGLAMLSSVTGVRTKGRQTNCIFSS